MHLVSLDQDRPRRVGRYAKPSANALFDLSGQTVGVARCDDVSGERGKRSQLVAMLGVTSIEAREVLLGYSCFNGDPVGGRPQRGAMAVPARAEPGDISVSQGLWLELGGVRVISTFGGIYRMR
ncbi:MAG: hypothetical protein VYE68_08880 [Acidobacteriota bacterium]|nr:hypothetical protein [Acidobacteriota bacterium]